MKIFNETGSIIASLHNNWGWIGTHYEWFSYTNWNVIRINHTYNNQMFSIFNLKQINSE